MASQDRVNPLPSPGLIKATTGLGGPLGASSTEPGPDATSSDFQAMSPYFDQIDAILGGSKSMRDARETYLPRFPNENQKDYDIRRKSAKFTNVFRDIVESLAAKPFADEAEIKKDTTSERVLKLGENIDGQGNHIHVFAAASFLSGIAYAIDWILVDYTKLGKTNATVAEEQKLGARPYWVHIPARRMLAAYSAMIDGTEQFVHVRIAEDYTERSGYGEKTYKRVRVLNREETAPGVYADATYEVWEAQTDQASKVTWVSRESGAVTIGVIPLVPFITGRRIGCSWQIVPPMQDAADLQIELFQQESGLKYIKEMTCFPMLAGNGVMPSMVDGKAVPVPVGPKAVLYAPPQGDAKVSGSWTFIEPSAQSLTFLAGDVKETIQQLRELGRQPLTPDSGNVTVITARMNAQKANSAIQAWAINLKDAIENALRYTVMWLKEDQEPEFSLTEDFDLGLNDDKGPDTLLAMRKDGDLSQETLWHEMRRRSILSPEFDAETEIQALLDETPGQPTPEEIAAMAASMVAPRPPAPGSPPGPPSQTPPVKQPPQQQPPFKKAA